MKLISIVIPLYNEALNIEPLYRELVKLRTLNLGYAWEYLFINDGSSDDTWPRLKELASQDDAVKVIDLSRNYGKEIALSAGVFSVTGDCAIFIDADLQHPPACIPEMLQAWEEGVEVVEMIRSTSEGEPLFRKLGSYVFYKLLNKISDFQIRPHTTDFRLIDRKVVDALCTIKEKKRMFRGLIDWMGYQKKMLTFVAPSRIHGDPGYSLNKLIGLALTSFVSYSTAPLKFVGLFGAGITVFSGLLFLTMVGFSLVAPEIFSFTPLAIVVVANTFLMGLLLSALGIVALYVNKIYEEVRDRPLFVIRETGNMPFVATERDRLSYKPVPAAAVEEIGNVAN